MPTRKSKRPSRCSRGKIMRKGYRRSAYTRSDGTKVKSVYVPPSCIKDRGLPGKGTKLFEIKDEGFLREFGFSTSKPASARRSALHRAIDDANYSKVIKKLNAVAILNKNTNPSMYKKIRSDMAFLKKRYRPSRKSRQ